MSNPPVSIRVEETAARPSVVDLVRRLVDDVTGLARTEIKLARAEVAANVASLVPPLIMIIGGMLLGIAALFTLLGAFVGWLSPYVGPGWAALIVAVVVGVIAAILAKTGVDGLGKVSLGPKRTVASVKADVQTVKGAAR